MSNLIIPPNMLLRAVNDNDHEFLVDLHNDPVVLHNITNPQPITLSQHLSWWKKVSHDRRQLRLIFEVDNQRAGFCKFYDINHVNRNCVLGADLTSQFRNRGLAKYMWQLMLITSFDGLQLHRVSLTTAEYNTIAQHVYKGLGFKEEGRLIQSLFRDGRYYDQLLMYLLADDWNSSR